VEASVKMVCLALAALSLVAQSADSPPPPAPLPPDLTFKVGGQTDSAQGTAFQGKVSWNPTRALTLFVSADRSNLASTTEAPSPSGSTTTTTTTSLGGEAAFGLFCLGAQYDRSDMTDLLTSQRYYLQPALDGGTWRIGLEFSTRRTTFDRLQFRNLILATPTGPVYVSGYADLDLSDTGLGANLEFSGEIWRIYGSYTHYSYGSFEGNTDVTRIRNSGGVVSPDIFQALSGRLVNRMERISTTRLSRKAALLDSTATAGLEADLARSRWGIEANQDKDHLAGEISNTLSATTAWKATRKLTLELRVGASRSDAFGTDHFAGLTLTYRTRPRPRGLPTSLIKALAELEGEP